jgi:hypothetical protein
MVWVGFLEEPLEVVCGWSRLTLVAVCGGRDVPHARATCLPIIAVIVVSRGHGPSKALLAPLFATLDALRAAVDGDVRRRSLIAARVRLSSSPGWVKHDRLIASGVLGGAATCCLECVHAKVAMLTLERAPRAALGLHAHATLASLAASLWLDVPALPL